MARSKARTDTSQPPSITFHYIKGQNFRVVHVDGAIGGLTPRGLIHAAVYSERKAIPTQIIQPIDVDGKLGSPTETVGRPGIVREMEVDLIMDRDAAVALQKWLGQKVEELDTAVKPKKNRKTTK